MQLALGIDTGGTYTDAVLVNHETGAVLAGAKALTTRHDLSIGIGGAIRAVFAARRPRVKGVKQVQGGGRRWTRATWGDSSTQWTARIGATSAMSR